MAEQSDYAIIHTGGRQYKVSVGDVLSVERLGVEPGQPVEFTEVLAFSGPTGVLLGAPTLEGAKVVAQSLGEIRGRKIRGFKFKPKKHYKRSWGHRQLQSRVRITSISV